MRSHFLAAVATFGILALTTVPQKAHAFELVTNGGFETGNFTGWTQSGNTGFTGVTTGSYAHSGTFGAFFGPIGSVGSISQSLATVAGQNYTFSYWLMNPGGTPNSFTARWDGNVIESLVNASAFGYTQYSYSVLATGASTNIDFQFQHNPDFWGLDDVSVNQNAALTPEMPAGVLALFAIAPVGFLAMKRRHS